MTKPKPIPDADTRVYTSSGGRVRAIVQDSGTAENYRVRATIQERTPEGTWRT